MGPRTTGSPLEDVAYLARSEHRVPTLAALAVRPRSRSELVEMGGVSSSTIRRTLTEFENRDWVRKEDYRYEATQLGGFVASAMVDLIDRIETEQKLRDVWHLLPGEESDFSVELCSDATVTVADADAPYRPVNRFLALVDDTDRCRFAGCDVALIEPCLGEFRNEVAQGMETTILESPNVVEHLRSVAPDLFAEALESGNLTIRLHDDLPRYGIGILDVRAVLTGYDPDSGALRVLVDTDAPAAIEWAESTYEDYRRETPTVPLEPTEG